MPETKNSNDPVMIPYFMAESMADRQQLTIKKLWILCILLIVLLVGTNGLWLWYESQFEYYEEVEQDVQTGNGDATVIGIGDYHGSGETDSKKR